MLIQTMTTEKRKEGVWLQTGGGRGAVQEAMRKRRVERGHRGWTCNPVHGLNSEG